MTDTFKVNYETSPFYNMAYTPLSKYIARCLAFVDDKSNALDVREKERFNLTEATYVLHERLERARTGDREAWSRLQGTPVLAGRLKGRIVGLIENGRHDSTDDFALSLYLEDTDTHLNIVKSELQKITFDRERMPKLKYLPE